MCGRYYIEIDDREIEEITQKIKQKLEEESRQLTIKLDGEIFPTETVPVQTGIGEFAPMKWGFRGPSGGTLINARSESAMEKKTFSDSMRSRRCIIPASGYYEWLKETGNVMASENTSDGLSAAEPAQLSLDLPPEVNDPSVALGFAPSVVLGTPQKKTALKRIKHRLFIPGRALHIAACWRLEDGVPSFVILTREAEGAAAEIHDRMPVIIPEERISAWLNESHEVMRDAVTALTVEVA